MNSTIQPIATQIKLNWLHYLAGNSQTTPTFFSYFQHNFLLIKKKHSPNFVPIFWTYIISELDGVQ